LSFCFWFSGKHPKRDVALNYNRSLWHVSKKKSFYSLAMYCRQG
jgi:hypothetical protein